MRELICRFCQRPFSKGEHLRRHERSHTGSKPYVCKDCHRSFGRQDSLARHERLHTRPNDSPRYAASTASASAPAHVPPSVESFPGSGDSSASEVNTSNVAHAVDFPPHQQVAVGHESAPDANFHMMPASAELDFELIWPDSEDLFHTIVSSDAANPWQVPLGTLPLPPGMQCMQQPIHDGSYDTPSSFDDRSSIVGAIPSGEGRQAVHDVSKMVTRLSSSVTAAVEGTSLTSVFLDECLHMFFVKFIPTFPVLHQATFIFRECAHPLLLNAIAIGSLYLGPKDAIAKGEALWRLAHTAVATSWESLITHRGQHDACNGIQLVLSALLGQLYGVLSQDRAIRTTSQAFHSLGFSWARACRMFDIKPFTSDNLPALDAPQPEKEYQWRVWVSREIQQRAILAHYMIDGLTAQMSGEPTSIRHAANQLCLPGSEAAFEASNCNEWLSLMYAQPTPSTSFRAVYRSLFSHTSTFQSFPDTTFSALSHRVVLEGLQSLVSDCDDENGSTIGVPTKFEIRRALAHLHDSITKTTHLSGCERLETFLRWHSICLDASIDSSLLCRYICNRYNISQHVWKDGKGVRPDLDLIVWANSPEARRALLHAVAIQDIIEELPRGRAHVIHMPSSLFAAATIYSVFSLAGITSVSLPAVVDWKHALAVDIAPPFPLSSSSSGASSGDDFDFSHSGATTTNTLVSLDNNSINSTTCETARYIRGDPHPNVMSFGGMGRRPTRNLVYELNSMQKLFRCLSSQWGVSHDMEKVVQQWIALCH